MLAALLASFATASFAETASPASEQEAATQQTEHAEGDEETKKEDK